MAEPHHGSSRHAEIFEEHRSTLLGAAYRVLGTVQDSEDAVQETWLRWQDVDLGIVRDPRSYLLRAVTRTALNMIRARSRRREEYIGPWLPEPVSTDVSTDARPVGAESPAAPADPAGASDPAAVAEIAADVSLALLVVLESLSPLERAAFVLHEAFDAPYDEIAGTLERSEPAVRQLVSRARAHLRDVEPRHPVDAQAHRAITESFLRAADGSAPLETVLTLLSPGVTLTTDGGGRAKAARRPVRGRDDVLRFVAGILAKPEVAMLAWQVREINGRPALLGHDGVRIDCVAWFEADDGLVTRIDMIRNPDKLTALRL